MDTARTAERTGREVYRRRSWIHIQSSRGQQTVAIASVISLTVACLSLALVCFVDSPLALGCSVGMAVAGFMLGKRAKREATSTGGKAMALAGVVISAISVLMFSVGVVVLPHLLRAGPGSSANRSAAIGDIRRVIEAEAEYRSASGGFYGSLDCLLVPDRCIPGYPATAPTFLDSQIAALTDKSGYKRTFYSRGATDSPGGATRTRLKSFVYVAVPVKVGPGADWGLCGDSSGRICFNTDGTAPMIVDGLCSPSCTTLK